VAAGFAAVFTTVLFFLPVNIDMKENTGGGGSEIQKTLAKAAVNQSTQK
jgi:hypothetical protein